MTKLLVISEMVEMACPTQRSALGLAGGTGEKGIGYLHDELDFNDDAAGVGDNVAVVGGQDAGQDRRRVRLRLPDRFAVLSTDLLPSV